MLHKFWTLNCNPNILRIPFREKRFQEEVEQFRQERPKIQQQFSDLKVNFAYRVEKLNFTTYYMDNQTDSQMGKWIDGQTNRQACRLIDRSISTCRSKLSTDRQFDQPTCTCICIHVE